jgi:hypothetical protein
LLSGGTNKKHSTPEKGRANQHKDASNKRLKTTRKTSSLKKVNISQRKVDGHQVDTINQRPNPHMHTIKEVEGLEDPDSLILRNHDEFHGVQEIFINYTNSEKLFDHTTMVVNSSTMVVDLNNDLDPKTMAECKQCSDWIK